MSAVVCFSIYNLLQVEHGLVWYLIVSLSGHVLSDAWLDFQWPAVFGYIVQGSISCVSTQLTVLKDLLIAVLQPAGGSSIMSSHHHRMPVMRASDLLDPVIWNTMQYYV